MSARTGRDDRLVGRRALVAEVESILDGGGAVVLHGPTGVGKSAVARHVRDARAATDAGTLWVQGTPGMADVPLGALAAHLVRGSADPRSADLGADPAALALRLLRTLPAGPLCVVDDLQWVDDLTVAVVHHLLETDDVRVLATVREGERLPPAAMALGRAESVVRVAVNPLDHDEVADLVAATLGGSTDAALIDHVAARAEGNPLFVTEMLAGAEGLGVIERTGGRWRLVGELVPSFVLAEVVTARLGALSAEATRAVELLALAEWLPVADAEVTAGSDALDELDRGGLVRVVDEGGREVLALSHPVYGEVVRTGLGALARRRHLRTLVEALGDVIARPDIDRLRAARWAEASGTPLAPDLAAVAGRLAFRTFDLDLAERLAQMAWEAEPSAGAATLLAEIRHTRGDHDGARALLAEAGPLVEDEHEAARGAGIEALGLLHGDGDAAAARALVRTARAAMGDREARLALYVAELYVLLMSESFDQLDDVVAALEAETPAHTSVASRQLVAATYIIQGRHLDADRLIATAPLVEEDLFVRSQDLALMAGGVRALALLRAGQTADAIVVATDSHRRCLAEGDHRSRAMAASALAIAAHTADDLDGLVRWSDDAVDALAGTFAPNLECLAQALALMAATAAGDPTASAAADAELERLAATAERLYAAWSTKARALAVPAAHDPAAGLLEAADRFLALGADEYAADLAHEAALLGGAPDALPIIGSADIQGELAQVRRAHVVALAAGDADALDDVAERFAALGCTRLARRALEAAAALAPSRRAVGLRHRADALASEGGGPWDLLTERERDVAALVARGLRSKEVAAELHLSPRTVDGNLQRIYAKLGIDDRRALARLAAELGLPAAVASDPEC